MGDIVYLTDLVHRCRVYGHLKSAFAGRYSPSQTRFLVRSFYQSFAQNFLEILLIPKVDEDYIRRFVTIHGRQHIEEAFRRGKGVIFTAVHAGPWEMANIICSHAGIPFHLFVGQLRLPRLEGLLMRYRKERGCRLIQRQDQLRRIMGILKANESLVMTVDQGGRDGTRVPFFGKTASMASGAVRLALKYDCVLLPVFPVRRKDQYIEFFVEPAFEIRRSQDAQEELSENLQRLTSIFESWISRYPQQYLWTYKVWKYSREKNILILSDGKAGHLRQSQGLADIARKYLIGKGANVRIAQQEVVFKSRIAAKVCGLTGCLMGKYICQGCMVCLRKLVDEDTYKKLSGERPDIIISCGSSLAAVNYLLARQYQARSFVVMRPSVLSTRRFDLVVMPRHDHPPRRCNVVVTEAALNLIDEEYLSGQKELLKKQAGIAPDPGVLTAGLLIGGDTKNFSLAEAQTEKLISRLQASCAELKLQLLVTTSRRTPAAVEEAVKRSLAHEPRLRLLIIANEKNYPSAVGGILGYSDIVIVSAESISMVSEAVASRKYVLVFGCGLLRGRHKRFLQSLISRGAVIATSPQTIGADLRRIVTERPQVTGLGDNETVRAALERLL